MTWRAGMQVGTASGDPEGKEPQVDTVPEGKEPQVDTFVRAGSCTWSKRILMQTFFVLGAFTSTFVLGAESHESPQQQRQARWQVHGSLRLAEVLPGAPSTCSCVRAMRVRVCACVRLLLLLSTSAVGSVADCCMCRRWRRRVCWYSAANASAPPQGPTRPGNVAHHPLDQQEEEEEASASLGNLDTGTIGTAIALSSCPTSIWRVNGPM